MSNVIALDSRRPQPEPPCAGCPKCSLRSLAARVRDHRDAHDGHLLTDWPTEAEMYADVLTTIATALDDNDQEKTR